jgi:hypothetical protein
MPETYCAEQGLGQHIGAGVPSATAEVAPRAKSKSVVTTILRMVLFMSFSPMVNLVVLGKCLNFHCAEQGLGQHIGSGTVSALAKVGA